MTVMNKKVEMEQKEPMKLAILLRTMTNGYMLDVNNEGYMYFNAQSLLEGFMVHVGLERLEAMTREEIKEMLESLKDGSAVKKLQAEVTELKALVDDQRKQIRELKRKIKELKDN
jgi:DNA-binding transcriptional MerR regulator